MKDLPVHCGPVRVGQVEIAEDRRPSFRYDPRWQASRDAFPVSLAMPLDRNLFPPEIVHPWLANLLPEERLLAGVAHNLGLARTDSLGLLEEIGGDVAGALSIGPSAPRQEWEYVPLTVLYGEPDPARALHRHFQDLRKRPFLAGEDGVRLSLAGGQEKSVLAVIGPNGQPEPGLPGPEGRIAIPLKGAPSTIIVKPDNPRLPGIAENEAYCLSLAAATGIEAAEAGLVQALGRTALAVVRYDRSFTADGSVRRLHQEDFAQALGVFPNQKHERRADGPSLRDILSLGDRTWCASRDISRGLPAKEQLRLLDQVIFNILVANTDAHAKNYALLPDRNGARMAPLFDVSSVLAWDHVNQYHGQDIAGRKRKPGNIAPRHWETIASEAGLNPAG